MVDREVRLPRFERLLPKGRGGARDTGVNHQHVNVARSGKNFLGGTVSGIRVGDVGLDWKRAVSDIRGGPFGAGTINIDDRDDGARLRQPACDRFSYACSRPRYDRGLAGQVEGSGVTVAPVCCAHQRIPLLRYSIARPSLCQQTKLWV
jgi:hypothetical protein